MKIELVDAPESQLRDKIADLNLEQAQKQFTSIIDVIKQKFPGVDYKEKLVQKYENFVIEQLESGSDNNLTFFTSKKDIYEMATPVQAAIKRTLHKTNDDILCITRGTSSVYTDNGNVELNKSFFEKNIHSELISQNFYVIDELAEKGPNKTELQAYVLKNLVSSDRYDKYEINNPMESALFRRDRNEVLGRVIGMKEYISNRVIKNALLEIKDIDKRLDLLKNGSEVDKVIGEPFVKDEKKIQFLEKYREDFQSCLVFAASINKIQSKAFQNESFYKDVSTLLKIDFNDSKNKITLMEDKSSIAVKLACGTAINNGNHWIIKDVNGTVLPDKYKSLQGGIDAVVLNDVRNIIEQKNTNKFEIILEQNYIDIEKIDLNNIRLIEDPMFKNEFCDILLQKVDSLDVSDKFRNEVRELHEQRLIEQRNKSNGLNM